MNQKEVKYYRNCVWSRSGWCEWYQQELKPCAGWCLGFLTKNIKKKKGREDSVAVWEKVRNAMADFK